MDIDKVTAARHKKTALYNSPQKHPVLFSLAGVGGAVCIGGNIFSSLSAHGSTVATVGFACCLTALGAAAAKQHIRRHAITKANLTILEEASSSVFKQSEQLRQALRHNTGVEYAYGLGALAVAAIGGMVFSQVTGTMGAAWVQPVSVLVAGMIGQHLGAKAKRKKEDAHNEIGRLIAPVEELHNELKAVKDEKDRLLTAMGPVEKTARPGRKM